MKWSDVAGGVLIVIALVIAFFTKAPEDANGYTLVELFSLTTGAVGILWVIIGRTARGP